MTNWLAQALHPVDELVGPFDARGDQQLRCMDITLALLALVVLSVPLLLVMLVGRLSSVKYVGCENRVFRRWQLRFPNNALGRLLARTGAGNWPSLINILTGEMAWVGYQAIGADTGTEYPAAFRNVRPGLVCIWDLRRRTGFDFGSEREANIEYLNQRGVRHDFALLLRASLLAWMPLPRPVSQARIGVGDVSFDNVTMVQAVKRISKMLDGARARQVSLVNPACVNIAAHDRGYRRLLARAALVLPDGIGIRIAAALLGLPMQQSVKGPEFFVRLCDMFAKRKASIFLLGGQAGVAEQVADVIRVRWPTLRIVGMRDGFFSVAQEGQVAAQVNASGADVVLVACGVPMQDVFIDRHLHQLGVRVAIGVGGLFDFVSGRTIRAPALVRKIGLDWLYRLLTAPARVWGPWLMGNFKFLGRIVLQRLGLHRRTNDSLMQSAVTMAPNMDRFEGPRCVLFACANAPREVPVADDFPAALLPYGWRTFVECVIEQLARHGVRVIDLVVSSRPEEFRQLLGHGERWGVQLRWHLAKDSATPYALLRSIALAPDQRLLLGHADRMVTDPMLASLIECDQMLALDRHEMGVVWAGWGSIAAGQVCAQSLHNDEAAMGEFLCQISSHVQLLAAGNLVSVDSAGALLRAQHAAMDETALRALPGNWLRTAWGAHGPDAVIEKGAQISGPVLIGPGCLVAAGATVGPGTVLTRDVVVSKGASIANSLVLPGTIVGKGLALEKTVVKGRSVVHLRVGRRTDLPASDGMSLELRPSANRAAHGFSRASALMVCLVFLPWLAIDTLVRRLRGLPLRWHKQLVALGRDADSGELVLKTLRCVCADGRGAGHVLSHYGEWMDVMAGHRSWFGSRPRSESEWYALGRDWQILLGRIPVGCLHAPAWVEGEGEGREARAAADAFYAVSQSLSLRLRIVSGLLRNALTSSVRPG